ncbi:MAG: pilus assembly PilX family protein [Pseudomonadota bacterium]
MTHFLRAAPGAARQRGVTMFVALIALVVMFMAVLTLVRSVDTGNLIAGNLAFRANAVQAADQGVEAAITWLRTNSGGGTLHASNPAEGYVAHREDPLSTQSWDQFWADLATANQVKALPANSIDTTVSYVIHRLCSVDGDPNAIGNLCVNSLGGTSSPGSGKGAGKIQLGGSPQYYYRVTTRAVGPRNTVSMVQVIVLI